MVLGDHVNSIDLSFDLEKVPLRAIDPHISEVVVPVEPAFPLKEIYEKTNGTIEGLRRRGSPEIEDGDGDEDEEVTKMAMMMGKETDGPKILTGDDEGAPIGCYTTQRVYSI